MIKRSLAIIATTLGVCFTLLSLLSIWEVNVFSFANSAMGKLVPTLGILTLAFISLLVIIKLTEK